MATQHGGRYRSDYVVEGSGDFPIDMLRYDCAWPKTEGDSHSISHWRDVKPRRVTLSKYHVDTQPQIGAPRWLSFGWRVVEIIETVRR